MRIKANVINVLISSPDDCKLERTIVEQAIFNWNTKLNEFNDVYYLNPITYERYYLASSNVETQSGINEDIVSKCEIGIAIFKEKIGGDENRISGTQQEIEYLRKNETPVKIHLSKIPTEKYIYKDLEDINRKANELLNLYNYFSQLKKVNKYFEEINDEASLIKSVEVFLSLCLIKIKNNDRIKEIEDFKSSLIAVNKQSKKEIDSNQGIQKQTKNIPAVERYNNTRELIIKNLEKNKMKSVKSINIEEVRPHILDILQKIQELNQKEFDVEKGIPFDAFAQIVKLTYPFIDNAEFGYAAAWKFYIDIFKGTNFGLFIDEMVVGKSGNKDYFVGSTKSKNLMKFKQVENPQFPEKDSAGYYKNFLETKAISEILLPSEAHKLYEMFLVFERNQFQKIEKQTLVDELKSIDKNYRSIIPFFIESEKIEQFTVNDSIYFDIKEIDAAKELGKFYEYSLNVLKLKLKNRIIDEVELRKLFYQ